MSLTKAQLSQLEAEDGFYDVDVVDELEDEEETGQSIASEFYWWCESTFALNFSSLRSENPSQTLDLHQQCGPDPDYQSPLGWQATQDDCRDNGPATTQN